MLGDLIATETHETQGLAGKLVGDREVGKPARGFAIRGDQRVEQRGRQRDQIEAC
jgi:hypothetical protein